MRVKNQILKDLELLISNIDNVKDEKKHNDLITDITNICKYLNLKIKYKKYNDRKKQVPEPMSNNGISKEMEQVIINNYLHKSPIKEKLIRYDDIEEFTLFYEFLIKDESTLINVYKNINSYSGIEYSSKKSRRICGENFYIKSLKKNYITIYNKEENKYSILLHELAHAKQNLYYTDNIYSSFIEMYPLFKQLVYSEYLKEKGLINKSYDIKKYVFYVCFHECQFLYEHIGVNYSNKKDYKYKLGLKRSCDNLLSCILAMKIYLIYIENKEKAISMINIFNNNINKVSKEELLNLMGLDMSIFNNKNILANFIFLLDKEIKKLETSEFKKIKK